MRREMEVFKKKPRESRGRRREKNDGRRVRVSKRVVNGFAVCAREMSLHSLKPAVGIG